MSEPENPQNLIFRWVSRGLIFIAILIGTSWFVISLMREPDAVEVGSTELVKPTKEDLERWVTEGEERHMHDHSAETSPTNSWGEPIPTKNGVNTKYDTMTVDWSEISEQLSRGLKTVGIERIVPSVETPRFDLPRVNGSNLSLADLRGKWVLLNFWASWCVPCREEMPALQRLDNRLPENHFELVGVNVGEDTETVQQAVSELKISFPVVRDEEARVTGQYRVQFLPTSWIIKPNGRILGRIPGAIEWDRPPAPRVFQQLITESRKR